jgi:hypothetical protein
VVCLCLLLLLLLLLVVLLLVVVLVVLLLLLLLLLVVLVMLLCLLLLVVSICRSLLLRRHVLQGSVQVQALQVGHLQAGRKGRQAGQGGVLSMAGRQAAW